MVLLAHNPTGERMIVYHLFPHCQALGEINLESSVPITQNYKNWNEFGYSGDDTGDNSVLREGSSSLAFKVIRDHNNGGAQDGNFSFLHVA